MMALLLLGFWKLQIVNSDRYSQMAERNRVRTIPIIAPRGVTVGTALMSGPEAAIKPGNCLPVRNIPVGTTIHCVEMMPGKGAQIARSAGTSVTLMAREGIYAQVRLRSNCRRIKVG